MQPGTQIAKWLVGEAPPIPRYAENLRLRTVPALKESSQENPESFLHSRTDRRFCRESLNVRLVNPPCGIEGTGDLVDVVVGDAQQPDHLFQLRKLQLDHIAVNGHLAKVSAHIAGSIQFHLSENQFFLFRGCPELDLLCRFRFGVSACLRIIVLPHSCPLGKIPRALHHGGTKALLTAVDAAPAQAVVAAPSPVVQEQRPFCFSFLLILGIGFSFRFFADFV